MVLERPRAKYIKMADGSYWLNTEWHEYNYALSSCRSTVYAREIESRYRNLIAVEFTDIVDFTIFTLALGEHVAEADERDIWGAAVRLLGVNEPSLLYRIQHGDLAGIQSFAPGVQPPTTSVEADEDVDESRKVFMLYALDEIREDFLAWCEAKPVKVEFFVEQLGLHESGLKLIDTIDAVVSMDMAIADEFAQVWREHIRAQTRREAMR